MSRKRQQKQIEEVTELGEGQTLCLVKGAAGANTFECSDGVSEASFLAELPPRFRKSIWIRRGSYVIVTVVGDSPIKIQGEISAVLQPDTIKSWKRRGIWPPYFEPKADVPPEDPAGYTTVEAGDAKAPVDQSDGIDYAESASEEDDFFVNPNRR